MTIGPLPDVMESGFHGVRTPALEPGFHGVPIGPARSVRSVRQDRVADGVGVA
jgi:hypothetical protein